MTKRHVSELREISSCEAGKEHLAELRKRIEAGGLDVEMVADYIMFCELGGQPDDFLSSKLDAAMEYLRVVQENRSRPRGGVAPNTLTLSEDATRNFVQSKPEPSQRNEGTAIRDIAVTISGLVGGMALAYWKFRSFSAESEAAEKRLRAAQLEAEAARTREDGRQSAAVGTQLGV
jgi:hypothetical protein